MKKLTYLLILALLIQIDIISQTCLSGGISFSTQAEIDNFQIDYPNCTHIVGNLEILGNNISNLDGLHCITSIGGNLNIGDCWSSPSGNPVITSLSGLSNLTSIGGDLQICQNFILANLSGLDGLENVAGSLRIDDNSKLNSLTGLESLNSIGGDLIIWFNDELNDLKGLDNLTSVGSNVLIEGNTLLDSLNGMENLTTIGGDLIIGCIYGWLHHNPNIVSLDGLTNLKSVGGGLWINLNDKLRSLQGLENLLSVGNGFEVNGIEINSNPALEDISGIANIDPNTITSLSIYDNTSLAGCAIQSICMYLLTGETSVSIYENMNGCNKIEEVQSACMEVSSVYHIFDFGFSFYPNPITDQLIIEFPKNNYVQTTIQVFDITGKKVYFDTLIKNAPMIYTISFSGLSVGVYFVTIQNEEFTLTEKIIKTK